MIRFGDVTKRRLPRSRAKPPFVGSFVGIFVCGARTVGTILLDTSVSRVSLPRFSTLPRRALLQMMQTTMQTTKKITTKITNIKTATVISSDSVRSASFRAFTLNLFDSKVLVVVVSVNFGNVTAEDLLSTNSNNTFPALACNLSVSVVNFEISIAAASWCRVRRTRRWPSHMIFPSDSIIDCTTVCSASLLPTTNVIDKPIVCSSDWSNSLIELLLRRHSLSVTAGSTRSTVLVRAEETRN